MKIIKITNSDEMKNMISEAVETLKIGGVVAHPTDTVWGLACDAENPKTVAKIHAIKKSDPKKEMLVIVPSKKYVDEIAAKLCKFHRLARAFWPGPLAMIVRLKSGGTLGVRYPDHDLSRELARKLGRPIVTTSANLSGQDPAQSANEVEEMFARSKVKPDLILDQPFAETSDGKGGAGNEDLRSSRKNKPSTIVDVSGSDWRMVREGAISREEMEEMIG